MKAQFATYASVSALILFSMLTAHANANWSSIKSGYALTTDYENNVALPETLVTATAGTTDANVLNVTFTWYDPNGNNAFQDSDIIMKPNGTEWTDGKTIYYAQSSHTPTITDYWTIQAIFTGPPAEANQCTPNIINHQYTIFKISGPGNVVPEIPMLGTASATLMLFFSLGLFLIKRKKII